MRILTKRNLLLGNLVLFLVFLLVAFFAALPLLQGRPDIQLASSDGPGADVPGVVSTEQEDYQAMKEIYPRAIALDNLFVPKTEIEKVVTPPPPLDPVKTPDWELVGIWQPEGTYYEANVNDKGRKEAIKVRKGARFSQYKLEVMDVTENQVVCMINEPDIDRQTWVYLTARGLRTAPVEKATTAAQAKDWSGFITVLRPGYYVVDMNEIEKECRKTAGAADWIEFLMSSVNAEPYKPSEEDADSLAGYKIVSFAPESPFDDLGVEVNDIILGVNRDTISGRSQARQLLRGILTGAAGGKYELRLERATKSVRIMIELQRF